MKAKLTEMLRRLGIWYFFPAANGMGRAGIPDVVCIVDGRFVGIECKSGPDRQPTALQLQAAKLITAAGGRWFLACDQESINDIEAWIKKDVWRADRGTSQGSGSQAQQP